MKKEEELIKREAHLFWKQYSGTLSPEEREELEHGSREYSLDEGWQEQMKSLEFLKSDYENYSRINDSSKEWARLKKKIEPKKSLRHRVLAYSSAAAILMGIWITLIFVWQQQEKEDAVVITNVHKSASIALVIHQAGDSVRLEMKQGTPITLAGVQNEANVLVYDTTISIREMEMHTLNVGKGGEYQVTLPDGTKVWLNSGSSLTYPVRFEGDRREVVLRGEAFFEVARNESKPFEVKYGDVRVEVLGTSFNIMGYVGEEYSQVTLATGKLRVSQGDQEAIILPNQQVEVRKNEIRVRDVEARYYVSWMGDMFLFDDESLEVIIHKLARWYDKEFEFEDSTLMKTHFSGVLPKYDDISKVFEVLEMTTNVQFTINPKTILIMRKK